MLITDKMKNILIGLFVVAAATIMVFLILFLEPKVGDGEKMLRVRFTNIAGIVVGTRVTFAGKPVGEVLHIREIKQARSLPPDEAGRFYFYELILKADSSIDVYDTDEIAIRSTGLMGEKSVAILPKKGKTSSLVTNEIIYANSTDPLENTFSQITKTAHQIEQTVYQIDHWFQQIATPLTNTIQEAQKITQKLDHSMDLLNEQGGAILTNLKMLSEDVMNGTGTLGRFLSTDDFYQHVQSLLSKADTLMNDINHYGILFQYDKHWQRTRTKRANLLNGLKTPQEFKHYFQEELDLMTTSLGRLTQLLIKAENGEETTKIIKSESFKKQFLTLLRNAESLTSSLKIYNQMLVSPDEDHLE